jgi:pimeloyl-ACP methyl ester carboxylesterase
VEDLLGDVREFVGYLGLERPLLMGVSFGGLLAMEYACRCPHQLGGLIVQGADVRFERTLLRRVAGEVLRDYPLPTDSPFVNQFFNLLFGGRPRSRALSDFVIRQCWTTDQSVMAHRFELAERIDLGNRLQCIRVPTLLISGTRDLLVSRHGLAEMVQLIPEAELVEIPSAGHLAFVTHADQVAASAARFAQDLGLLEAMPTLS